MATLGGLLFGAIAGKDYFVIQGIVLMRRGENPSLVLANVKEAVDELNATVLPAGVQVVNGETPAAAQASSPWTRSRGGTDTWSIIGCSGRSAASPLPRSTS